MIKTNSNDVLKTLYSFLPGLVILILLYTISLYNYLIFHTLAELFSIVVAWGLFIIVWNTKTIIKNDALVFLGIAYLFIGGLDLFHTLSYKGMGVLGPERGANPATQLWIIARFMESISLCLFPFFFGKRLKFSFVIWIYLIITAITISSIFFWEIFPNCYIEDVGLTLFKKGSEYIICLFLAAALFFLTKKKNLLDQTVYKLLSISIILTIIGELAFTFYISVYGLSNLIGHFFKIISFFLIYLALIRSGLRMPYETLFFELKNSEDEMKSIFRAAPTGIGVVFDRNLQRLNDRFCEMIGYSRNELIGQSARVLYPSDEEYEYVGNEKYKQISKKGTGTVETKMLHKNGNLIDVILSSTPIDLDDLSKGVTFTALDITYLKTKELELLESKEKYRHLFQNAPAGIYEIDFEKVKFINVNEVMCKYSGYSEKEFLSMNPLDLLTEDSRNLFIERLEKLPTKKNKVDSIEYNVIKKDGQELSVILNNNYIYKNGKLTGARVVVHDITELKKAQEDKTKAQKIAGEQKKLALVGQVAGKMAHDFNNILGIIMGNTELSLMDCKDEETKKTLELIFEQTIRGKNLTRNLVAFAKDQEPKQEFFRISEKIDLVLNLLRKDLEGIELIREDQAGVSDLLADPGMIEHAFVNLIQNSIHAVGLVEHPRIIIRTFSIEDNICFKIKDNGCGIPKKHLKYIFEPSFTLKGSKDTTGSYGREIKGTGYGMANVKKYIEQHKGSISVESKFGSGTKFTIRLPVIKKELTSQEKAEIQKENIYFDKYILLVEDEPAISGVQYKILSQEPCNHKVDIAHDGQVAMDLFKRNEYDLISLDYVLPGDINGMDVYDHIRKTNKAIPILFISGNIEFLESIKDLKQKDSNIDHLSKPCQNKDYVKSINELFGRNLVSKE